MKNQNTAKSLKALSNKLDKEELLTEVEKDPFPGGIQTDIYINSKITRDVLSFELTTSVTGISAELVLNGPKLDYTLSSYEIGIRWTTDLMSNYKGSLRTVKLKVLEAGGILTVLYFTDMEKK